MSRRRDPQGRLVPLCQVDGCVVAAIGYRRCVQHIAPVISATAKGNAPAVAGPGRSETASGANGNAVAYD